MSYDEWKATEPPGDPFEYIPCASFNCPNVVRALGVDELCEMCKATIERATRMNAPIQYTMMSHSDNPDHLIRRIRRAL